MADDVGHITITINKADGHLIISSSHMTPQECYEVCVAVQNNIMAKAFNSNGEVAPGELIQSADKALLQEGSA